MGSGHRHVSASSYLMPMVLLWACASGDGNDSVANMSLGDGDSNGTTDVGSTSHASEAESAGSPVTEAGEVGEVCEDPATWYLDSDGDGYGDADEVMHACEQPPGYVPDAGDCDDGDATVHPGAPEPCGGPDKDCDGVAPAACSSCLQVVEESGADADGLYAIDPDGPEGPLPPVTVWCDMNTDGGGWTLVQRTVWDPAQTSALRTGFSDWHNLTIGNASPGFGYRLQGEAWPHLSTTDEHLLRNAMRLAGGGACDPLSYKGVGGVLSIADGTVSLVGLASDAPIVSGEELSTMNSGPWTSCVTDALGVPWFYGSCCATCPTFQGDYWNEPHPMISYSHEIPDLHGNVETDVCGGPVEMTINGSSYRGVAVMEYYLR